LDDDEAQYLGSPRANIPAAIDPKTFWLLFLSPNATSISLSMIVSRLLTPVGLSNALELLATVALHPKNATLHEKTAWKVRMLVTRASSDDKVKWLSNPNLLGFNTHSPLRRLALNRPKDEFVTWLQSRMNAIDKRSSSA
jgi:hypothetical protein